MQISIQLYTNVCLLRATDMFVSPYVYKRCLREKPSTPDMGAGRPTAVAIAAAFIHRSLVSSRVHRVRAALDFPDWTRLGPYHTYRSGEGRCLKRHMSL